METIRGDRVRFEIQERVLDNGLRVLALPDPASPVVAVHLMVHVGSRNETPGRTGFAHLFEHLLFQGSVHVPKGGHFRRVQAAGGTLNGTTWFDRTNFFEVLPAEALDLALWLESDRLGWFLPALTDEKFDNQRGVVKNERRQSYENRPYGLAVETVLRHAFPEGHPYRHPTIGYMEDLDAATLADAESFFRSWYGPGNAVLVVAGGVRADDAFRAVERWFGPIAAREAPPSRTVPSLIRGGEARAVLADRVQVPRVYRMYHAPAFPDARFEAASVLCALLTGGRSSRLHRSLVYERRVAADVSAFAWPTEKCGMLWIVATGRPGVDAAGLEEAMEEGIEELRASGPSKREMEGARNRSRRSLVRGMDGAAARADHLAHATVLRGDPNYLNDVFGRYAAVDAAAVESVLADVLGPEGRTVLHVVPDGRVNGETA
jgi:zinc protease